MKKIMKHVQMFILTNIVPALFVMYPSQMEELGQKVLTVNPVYFSLAFELVNIILVMYLLKKIKKG